MTQFWLRVYVVVSFWLSLSCFATAADPNATLPSDWHAKVATGWMLADTAPPLSPDLCPTFGNGFIAAAICPHHDIESSSGTFLSGYYSGTCPATGAADGTSQNARATLPTVNLFAALHNATYVGMALDLQNATVTRRFRLSGCALEVAYFAHRSIRHLMVLAVTASAFSSSAGPRCVVRPTPLASSSQLDHQCSRRNGTTACTSVS